MPNQRYVLLVYLTAPVPLVAGLAFASMTPGTLLPAPAYLWAAAAVAAGLLLIAELRRGVAHLGLQGLRLPGAGATVVGMAAYMAGSVHSLPPLHWAGLVMMYEGLVLFLGGVNMVKLVGLASLAFLPLCLPEWGYLWEASALALAASGAALLYSVLRTKKHPLDAGCARCSRYEGKGEAFCLSCGKLLGALKVGVDRKGLALVAGLTCVLLLASMPQTQVVSRQDGAYVLSAYKLAGTTSSAPIVGSQGWNITQSSTSPYGTATLDSVQMASGGRTVRVVVASSPNPQVGGEAIGSVYPFLRRLGPVTLGEGFNPQQVTPDVGGQVGVMWTSDALVFNGAASRRLALVIVVIETLPSTKLNGTGVAEVASDINHNLALARGSDAFNENVTAPAMASGAYAGAAAMVFLVGVPFEAARRLDQHDVKVFENSFGLSDPDLEVFALLTAMGPSTGVELLSRKSRAPKDADWLPLEASLATLERFGLVVRRIVAWNGRPRMLWRSALR